MSINPFMNDFITRLAEHSYQKRTVGLIENGSWAPLAAKAMRAKLETCRDITFAEHTVQIRSALNEDSIAQIEALAEELCS